MKIKMIDAAVVIIAVAVLLFAIFGPERVSAYKDKSTLNKINVETAPDMGEGFKYTLDANERLYILSKCIDSMTIPESELSASTNIEPSNVDYEEITGTYAMVLNRQKNSDVKISSEEVFDRCNEELNELKELGIIPLSVKDINSQLYGAELYSAIDVLEPRNNISVWKISLLTDIRNADKADSVIDIYMDADSGSIYEFYVRGDTSWESIDPEKIVADWADYLGLYGMEEYFSVNPLLEPSTNYVKYSFPGADDTASIVTLGFYEGINELYLKII
jgi:hypothetical protein